MKQSFGINVPAFQASILFVSRNHALTRVATYSGRFAPGSSAARSKHKVGNDFRASLEEAVVRRPGRKAGIENSQILRSTEGAVQEPGRSRFFTAPESNPGDKPPSGPWIASFHPGMPVTEAGMEDRIP